MFKFHPPLIEGRFISRYKRFFADIDLCDGGAITAHCANTGKMTGLLMPNAPVWVRQQLPDRKLQYSWELIKTDAGDACVNTMRANHLVLSHLDHPIFRDLRLVRKEPRVGNHRFDFEFLASGNSVYVEVKSVTFCHDSKGAFPDAPSNRAVAHLNLLTSLATQGIRTLVLFVAMHTGIRVIRPATEIDPRFSAACNAAKVAGVEICAVGTSITPTGISMTKELPVELT